MQKKHSKNLDTYATLKDQGVDPQLNIDGSVIHRHQRRRAHLPLQMATPPPELPTTVPPYIPKEHLTQLAEQNSLFNDYLDATTDYLSDTFDQYFSREDLFNNASLQAFGRSSGQDALEALEGVAKAEAVNTLVDDAVTTLFNTVGWNGDTGQDIASALTQYTTNYSERR